MLVSDVNDAPVLTPANPAMGVTDVAHDLTTPIQDFVVGVSDVDLKNTLFGIAVTGRSGVGKWYYSLDAGQHFTPVPAVSPTQALLLFNHHQLRISPID